MKVPVSKVFVAFVFWERLASKCSTTLPFSPLLSAILQSPSSLSSMSKAYGLRQESALSWMRFRSGTSCEQVFDDIALLASLICDTPIAIIAFIDEQSVWFKARIGLELDEIPRDGSFCAYAILQSDLLIVPDPSSDERFMNSFLVKQIGIQFYAGIP